jgi:hypothetical protein
VTPGAYRERWGGFKTGNPAAVELEHLAREIALSFLDRYFQQTRYEGEYIRLLCEMATSFENDPEKNAAAARALFGVVVETLCDDFEDLQTETYNMVMTQVIAFCRTLPAGAWMDEALRGFGLSSARDLLDRIHKIRVGSRPFGEKPPAKIAVLSRVTIGADVAITSVILDRLARRYPGTEIIVLGGAKLAEIFGGNPRLTFRELHYRRRGGLLERFARWHEALDILRAEAALAGEGELWVVDPDSRISQLGILPLSDTGHYWFFNSREKPRNGETLSMAEWTNRWLDRCLKRHEFRYPSVWLPPKYLDPAKSIRNAFREAGCRRLFTVNFGVGGNARKRLDEGFETALVSLLASEPGTVVLLDRGFGAAEFERTGRLLQNVAGPGHAGESCEWNGLIERARPKGVIGVCSKIGEMAALISQSDEYFGYDSAGQHIAASLGVRTVTVFAGSNNPRFVRRWQATGPGRCDLVHVDTLSRARGSDAGEVIERIRDLRVS